MQQSVLSGCITKEQLYQLAYYIKRLIRHHQISYYFINHSAISLMVQLCIIAGFYAGFNVIQISLLLKNIIIGMNWQSSGSDDDQFSFQDVLVNNSIGKEKGIVAKVEQKVKEKVEVPEDLTVQLTEENTYCQICYKYALNAVICDNNKCAKMFCSKCGESSKVNQQNRCPFCRVAPFQYSRCPYAKKINKMLLPCSLCSKKFILQEELIHYKQQCQALLSIQCRFCELTFLSKTDIVKHTQKAHANKIESIIESIYNCPPPQFDYKSVLLRQKKYLDVMDRRPNPGTTGKFYCGGKLQTKCTCCNGFCGPTNGQNCLQCMKLDLKRLGLPKGYLVNSSGHICYKRGNDFVCGVRLYYEGTNCDEGNTCNSCKNMKKNIKRYESLL